MTLKIFLMKRNCVGLYSRLYSSNSSRNTPGEAHGHDQRGVSHEEDFHVIQKCQNAFDEETLRWNTRS